tara:strand:- start:990 stop:1622 length:633 start_codon:yes stop_codon:yes gene_type:complete
MEIITRSRYSIEKVGIFDLSEFEKQGDFSHKVLIDEIVAQGDRIGQTSNVKAPMTEWNMCYESVEFQKLGSIIVREGIIPYLGAYYNNIEDIKKQTYIVNDMWGAEYRGNGDDFTQPHDHRASYCSFSYYLQTPEGSPPLVFNDMRTEVQPTVGMLVCFKGDYRHSVPKAKHDGSRIMIAGNSTLANPERAMVEILRMGGYEVNEPVQNS